MSAFGRAFLRLATCAALRDQTLVGGEVYDSRIPALDPETLAPDVSIAGTIGVYTEQDSGPALSSHNGGPPFVPVIELVIEIAMQAKITGEDILGVPETDDQLETTIDFIEGQAELALWRRQHAAALGFRKVAKRVEDKSSVRFIDPASSAKLAIRYVTYKIEIEDPELPIFDDSLTGLDRLPEPWRTVALAWPDGSVEREKAENMADALVPQPMPALEGIDATIARRDFSSEFDEGGDFSETQTTFTVEIPQT
jgi:hypothetical protein